MRLDHQQLESAKQRSLRIPLDYLRGLDHVQRWKLASCVLAALATAAYGAMVVVGSGGPEAFAHGPVANAHATWESNCSACHVDFVAIREDAANPWVRAGLVRSGQDSPSSNSIVHLVDQKCQDCHAGPRHHNNERADEGATCASCHQDHRGRTADIARPAHKACIRCHRDIAAHRAPDSPSSTTPPIENVSSFPATATVAAEKTHPEFRSLASDPGNVKFHHALHMAAGLPAVDLKGEGKKLLTLADLPEEFRERYRRTDQPRGDKPDREYYVQLACDSCHRSDPAGGDRGAHMLPVRFEQHCQACHHLHYEPAPGKELPHGLGPQAAREFLLGRYMAEATSGRLAANATQLIPRRPIPGRSPDDFSAPGIHSEVQGKVAAAERHLRDTNACGKCHLFKSPEPTLASSALSDTVLSDSVLSEVLEPNIPETWFRHARFDHSSHRALTCAECHAAAYCGPTNQASQPTTADQDVVMISGRDSCLRCHAPHSADRKAGGARFDCVECHRYHGTVKAGALGLGITAEMFLGGGASASAGPE